jgi:hypothetical protein
MFEKRLLVVRTLRQKVRQLMAKRALLVGIEEYEDSLFPPLRGCANDAKRMAEALKFDYLQVDNFDCKVLSAPLAASGRQRITRAFLRKTWMDLFKDFDEDILFYFSGHGMPLNTSGYLITQDGSYYDPGLTMNELFTLANMSKARSVLLILDCCHAGMAGGISGTGGNIERADIREGVTLLAAASSEQEAQIVGGRSVFTDLVIGALQGGAANVEGHVTAASIYSFVESSLGAFDQRPIYKSFARRLEPITRCKPYVDMATLRAVIELFPKPDHEFPVDPDYDEYRPKESPPKFNPPEEVVPAKGDPEKNKIRKMLRSCRDAGLLKPIKWPDLFWAMMYSDKITLTPLGRYYWNRLRKRD